MGARTRLPGRNRLVDSKGSESHRRRRRGCRKRGWRGIKLSVRYELRDITQGTRLPDRDLFDIRLTLGF